MNLPQLPPERSMSTPVLVSPSLGGLVGQLALVLLVVTVADYLVPAAHDATAVGLIFLGATYLWVWNRNVDAGHYGLSLAGLFESAPMDTKRLLRESAGAVAIAFLSFAVIAWPFFLGFKWYRGITQPFSWSAALPTLDESMGQLLVISFPEEAFFRGYVQTQMTDILTARGSKHAPWIAIVVTSAVFAVGHLLTRLDPARLAVFFPSLAFGLLMRVTRGVGAGTVFHALCNLLSAAVARGFGAPS